MCHLAAKALWNRQGWVMRSLLSILAGMVVVSGIVSANLWLGLRTERRLNADLRAQLVEERSAIRPSAPPTYPAPEPTAPPVATAARNEAAPEGAPEAATGIRIGSAMPPGVLTPSEQNLLADPEYRDALLARTRLSLRSSHPGLIEELGLSGRDADDLFALLAESQLRPTIGLIDGRTIALADPAVIAERGRLQRENQATLNDSLVALLGNERYAQFQDYQRTRGARSTVATFGHTLAQANQPLTAAQTRTLLSAIATEQQRQQGDAQAATSRSSATTGAQLQEEQLNRQEEGNRRMLGVMAPHLAPQQLETLRTQFESQIALSRASARVRRERDRVAQGLQ
jgi:hypothetical protein